MVLLRCLAGFSVGAEYTGTMVYLMETASPGKRGVTTSWAAANSEIGSLLLMRNLAHAQIDDLDRDDLLVGAEP